MLSLYTSDYRGRKELFAELAKIPGLLGIAKKRGDG